VLGSFFCFLLDVEDVGWETIFLTVSDSDLVAESFFGFCSKTCVDNLIARLFRLVVKLGDLISGASEISYSACRCTISISFVFITRNANCASSVILVHA